MTDEEANLVHADIMRSAFSGRSNWYEGAQRMSVGIFCRPTVRRWLKEIAAHGECIDWKEGAGFFDTDWWVKGSDRALKELGRLLQTLP